MLPELTRATTDMGKESNDLAGLSFWQSIGMKLALVQKVQSKWFTGLGTSTNVLPIPNVTNETVPVKRKSVYDLNLVETYSDVLSLEMEIIRENLLSFEDEVEDAFINSSHLLPQILTQAQKEAPSSDWERDIDEL